MPKRAGAPPFFLGARPWQRNASRVLAVGLADPLLELAIDRRLGPDLWRVAFLYSGEPGLFEEAEIRLLRVVAAHHMVAANIAQRGKQTGGIVDPHLFEQTRAMHLDRAVAEVQGAGDFLAGLTLA
jgi:hypothetical protein